MERQQAKITPLVKTNLNNQIYQILKEMIADQRFNPGGSINVEQLTHELDVSRTPVWEAIRTIGAGRDCRPFPPQRGSGPRIDPGDGLGTLYRPGGPGNHGRPSGGRPGHTVQLISRMEKCLEKQAQIVKQEDAVAYSRSDYEFHLLIYEASGNQSSEGNSGRACDTRPCHWPFVLPPSLRNSWAYHRKILEAFRQKDGHGAEKAIRRTTAMIELIETAPGETSEPVTGFLGRGRHSK